jgi:hypothetical protein
MPQIVATPEMARILQDASGPVMIVNEQGTMIGYCTPVKFPHSPYSREEIERRRDEARKHPEKNKSFADVLAHLNRLAEEKS